MVRFKTGEPFAGVVMSIRRRGPDSSILLRNHLTRVGTELWVKIYSPTVVGMEVVRRSEKKIRRARLYYLRYVMLHVRRHHEAMPSREAERERMQVLTVSVVSRTRTPVPWETLWTSTSRRRSVSEEQIPVAAL